VQRIDRRFWVSVLDHSLWRKLDGKI
jgi:hypothetical protein